MLQTGPNVYPPSAQDMKLGTYVMLMRLVCSIDPSLTDLWYRKAIHAREERIQRKG